MKLNYKSWNIAFDAAKDIKNNLNSILQYELGMKFVSAFFVYPLIIWIFNVFMHKKGFTSLSNNQFLKMAFSWQGIIAFLIILIIALLFMVIELGGLVLISEKIINKENDFDFQKIIMHTIRKFSYFIGPGGLLMAAYFFLISPLIGLGINTSLLNSLNLPSFIENYIFASNYLIILYELIAVCLFLLAIRWIFSVHYIMLEDEKPSIAMSRSWKLIKTDIPLFAKYFIGTQIASALIVALFTMIWFVFLIIGIIVADGMKSAETFLILFNSLNNILIYLFISLAIPFNIIGITRLFYILKEEHEEPKVYYSEIDFIGFKLFKFGWVFKKRIVIVFLILFFSILSFINMQMNLEYSIDIKKPMVTAHRGASLRAPENTMSSLLIAIKDRNDFAEIDIQETKDGVLVVTHDRNILRFTGIDKEISDINYRDLVKLDFGKWFDEKFEGEKISTLEEFIDASNDKIKLNIELKGDGASDTFVDHVVKLIESKNFQEKCIVTSLDLEKLKKVRNLNSTINTGYIIYLTTGNYKNVDVDSFCVEISILTQDFIVKAHELGKDVWVWTPNTEEEIEKQLLIGVDNIITDNPQLVDEVYERKIKEDKLQNLFDRLFLLNK